MSQILPSNNELCNCKCPNCFLNYWLDMPTVRVTASVPSTMSFQHGTMHNTQIQQVSDLHRCNHANSPLITFSVTSPVYYCIDSEFPSHKTTLARPAVSRMASLWPHDMQWQQLSNWKSNSNSKSRTSKPVVTTDTTEVTEPICHFHQPPTHTAVIT
jgi:hypothetical protein